MTALITKYRPASYDGVLGQSAAVKALRSLVKTGDAQAFLFSGPSGTGKTTLARITALAIGCAEKDVQEIPAANYTGVEDMRAVQSGLHHIPFGSDSGKRAIILDEAHRLSKQAWDSLLKIVEEPPPHVYWFLCTTEAAKIPQTIKGRCAAITLKPVGEKPLGELLDRVLDDENIDMTDQVANLIISEANGSPRQLLSNIAICRNAANRKEAAELLRAAQADNGAIELCRFLAAGRGSWGAAMAIVKAMTDPPESIRIMVSNYFAVAARDSKSERDAMFFLRILSAFAKPYNPSDGQAPLLMSIARLVLDRGE